MSDVRPSDASSPEGARPQETVRVKTESIDAQSFVRLTRDDCGIRLVIESEDGEADVYLSAAAWRQLQGFLSPSRRRQTR